VREIVEPYIRAQLPEGWVAADQLARQPDRRFVIGGPDGDAGLTGRKIIVDTYGGAAPSWRRRLLGQGPDQGRPLGRLRRALSGQERRRRGARRRCTIQLSYAIGVAEPLSIYVDTYGTGKVDDAAIETALREVMDLSPRGIRKHLDLNKPIYAKTAAYGHFGRKPGRDGSFAWEKTNLVKPLKEALGVK
jgi:S-adenosylmethionine synthetase